jgi:hypothetical protein
MWQRGFDELPTVHFDFLNATVSGGPNSATRISLRCKSTAARLKSGQRVYIL